MAKITELKLIRRFNPDVLVNGSDVQPYKVFPCPVCQEDMRLAPGQIMACHKRCKPFYRKQMKIARNIFNLENNV